MAGPRHQYAILGVLKPIKIRIVLTFLLLSSTCFSQVDEILHAIYAEDFEAAQAEILNFTNKKEPHYFELLNYYHYSVFGLKQNDSVNKSPSNEVEEVLKLLNEGNEQFFNLGNSFAAYLKYKDAHKIAKESSNSGLEKIVLKDLLSAFSNNYNFAGAPSYQQFLERFESLMSSNMDKSIYYVLKIRLDQRFKSEIEDGILDFTKLADAHFKDDDSTTFVGRYYGYKSYNYINKLQIPDSAITYSKISIKVLKNKNGIHNKERYIASHLATGRSYLDLNKPDSALYYIKQAPVNTIQGFLKDNLLSYYYYYSWLAFENKNIPDSVFAYKLEFYQHDYKLKLEENTNNVANYDELYRTEELKKNNQRNLILFLSIGAGVLLLFILVYNNIKRKKKIAEQERELEIQKKEKILKDQELTTIDAMISGQEKERQRLASDLHDSVGATLAAAKLQFHHLSKNRDKGEHTDELFTKTGKLLEDAYTEIRTMAHVKNSGVIAKNGLLPAVQKLAKNASGINGLHIEVEDFGLEERLENTLEISVFRIVQELVTNIIKHSQATEASISINQYKDSLNIIVEDNGNGFDVRSLQQNDGMGLGSIEKRIEHLEGTLEVDSTPKKGTTILIDIPL